MTVLQSASLQFIRTLDSSLHRSFMGGRICQPATATVFVMSSREWGTLDAVSFKFGLKRQRESGNDLSNHERSFN